MGAFARGPVWPDAAGTATDPTTTLVTSSRELEIHDEGDLACRLVVTGAACRAIVLEAQVTTDGTTWRTVARKTVLGASVGTHQARLQLPRTCLARVRARRYGGTAASRLVVHADARIAQGEAALDGQPLELAGHQVAGVECWGDGAGAAAAMAAGPGAHVPSPAAAADQQWIPTGEADALIVYFTTAVAAPTSVEFEVRERAVGSAVEVELEAVDGVSDGVVEQRIAQQQIIFGALDTRRSRPIRVTPGSEVLILAQYTGGAGGTTGLGLAKLYKGLADDGDGAAPASDVEADLARVGGVAVADAAPGVAPVAVVPQVLAGPDSIIDDGGAPVGPVAITDAYAANASAWIDLDDACTDLAIRVDTAADTPTSFEIEILWHEEAAATAALATAFYTPVVDSVVGGREALAPRESSWRGRASAALPTGSYRHSFERPAEALSYLVRVKRTAGANTTAQVWATQIG